MKHNRKKVSIKEIICSKLCQFITGLLGIMSVIFNLRNTDALRIDFTIILVVSVVSVIAFTLIWKKALYAAGGIILLYGVVRGISIIKSLIYFANDIYDTIYSGGLVSLADDIRAEKMAQLTEMLVYLCILCSWLIVINVRCIKSMFIAVILTSSLSIIYTAALVIPAGYIWIAGIGYVIGVAAGDNYRTGLVSEVLVGCVGILLVTLMSDNYKKPQMFNITDSKMAVYIQSHFDIDFTGIEFSGVNQADNSTKASASVINSGRLGRQDSIELSSKQVGYVVTENTGKTQYIKTFTGGTYIYGMNRWEADKADVESSENMPQYLNDLVVNGKSVPDMVNNNRTGNARRFSKHTRDINISGRKSVSEDFYDISPQIYSTLYDISHSDNAKLSDILNDVKNQYTSLTQQTQTSISDVSSKKRVSTLSDYVNAIAYVNRFFESNYRYTLSPGRVPDGKDFVDYFLTESKAGYCSYFASAATLMFRSYGMPARYVEGYMLTDNEIDASDYVEQDGRVRVNIYSKDAHAWVEVYLDGIGWIIVDPTPSSGSSVSIEDIRRNQNGQDNSAAMNSNGGSSQNVSEESTDSSNPEQTTEQATVADNNQVNENKSIADDGHIVIMRDEGASEVTLVEMLLILLILVVLIIVIAVWLLKRRSARRFHALTESGDIVAIYDNLEKLMKIVGMVRPAHMDYVEYARYMEKNDNVFKAKEYADIVEKAVNIMYSNGRYQADADSEMIKHYIGLRNYIYSRMPLLKNIYVMYILAL